MRMSKTLPPQPPPQSDPLVFQPRKVVEHITLTPNEVDMRFCYDLPDGSSYEICIEGRAKLVPSDVIPEARKTAHMELRAILDSRRDAMSAHDRLALPSEHGGAA